MSQDNNSKNVTDKFSIEELIDRKKRNLEAIFDSVPVSLLLVDEHLNIIRVNDTTRKLTNKDYCDIINHSTGQALNCTTVTIDQKECGKGQACKDCPLRLNMQKTLQTTEPVHEFEFQSKTHFQDREQNPWFALSIEPVIIEDKNYIVVCLHDVTERKSAEEKLIEAMEMKSQFISTVSHDLRTPLTAIKEGIDIILEGLAGKVKKKQRKFLELAKRNVDRLNLLVNDVLDFQRLDSGGMKFDFTLHKVTDTIREVTEIMTLLAKKNNITLTVDIASDIGEAVFDHNRISQVLTNLLSNAIKFTPQNGSVSLEAIRQHNEIVITLSDTGIGIPKEDLSKIFEKFYRVERTANKTQGTGLGLAIVAQIIKRHNGRILVESQPGKGTTFTIHLPVDPAESDTDKDAANG
ncbi:MAG: GHKL domain-containing protein [Sedimentisphaerales bacterium]|nr:GHKL domain-containing protein [Sedimentisphaerales bacterium]